MDRTTAETILSRAVSLKADSAEVFLRSSSGTSIEIKEQQVDAFERSRDVGAGLRVLVGSRMGFAFATDLSDASVRELAASAVTNALTTEPDSYHAIPDGAKLTYPKVRIHDPEIPALNEK